MYLHKETDLGIIEYGTVVNEVEGSLLEKTSKSCIGNSCRKNNTKSGNMLQ